MTIDDHGTPTPHASRLPSDMPPPRRQTPDGAQATAGEGESSSAVSAPASPSQDPGDRPDGTTSGRAVVRAIFDALTPTARALVAGALLAWLRLVIGYATHSVSLPTAEHTTDGIFGALHGEGHIAPAEAAVGAWFGSSPGDLFALVDCDSDQMRRRAEGAAADLAEVLAAAPGRPRVVRLPLDAPARRSPDPREAMVRGIVEAFPPARARNALRGALAFLRTLDGIEALSRWLERSPAPSPGQRAQDEQALRRSLRAVGSVASYDGRRRTALARRTLITAVIGVDPMLAAQLAADSGFPTRTRSGIAILERVLLDAKAGAA